MYLHNILPFTALLFSQCLAVAPPQQPLSAGLDNAYTLSSTEKEELFNLHKNLVEIESISGNEAQVGQWLADYLTSKGLTVEKQAVDKDRWNIHAYPGSKRETDILISSHIDTVPPFWPYHYTPSNHTIFGRGSVDAKASVSSQIIAALAVLATYSQESPPSLALLFVVDEETGGRGMRHFSSHAPTSYRAVIFGEPTENRLCSGHKGNLGFTLAATGKAAHSGYPWLGVSANDILVQALSTVKELEAKGGLPRSDKYGNTTVNVGRIEGGVAANVVSETATAAVAVRLAGGTWDRSVGIVKDALAGVQKAAAQSGGSLDIEFHKGYGPIDIDCDVEGFSECITVNYGTDIPNLQGDHKRYLYGPGSILVAHSAKEELVVEDLEKAVVDYRKLILAALEM